MSISPTETQALAALRAFLSFILPNGIEIIRGQDNRVPEPVAPDFVVMTPIRRERLMTNLDIPADCSFMGSISGSLLTVTQNLIGTLQIGATIFGPNVLPNTVIMGNGLAPNTFVINQPQNISSQKLACGQIELVQSTELVVQLDVHGPGSGDNTQTITTAFRDDYAFTWFEENYPGISPLYAENAMQAPFLNDQQQIEFRWVVEARLQYLPAVILPQTFADRLEANVQSVQAAFPA